GLSAGEAGGGEALARAPERYARVVCEHAHVTQDPKAAAVTAGAARIGDQLVALDAYGKFDLHRFDRQVRRVRHVDHHDVHAVGAAARPLPTPQVLVVDEVRPAAAVRAV